MDYYQITLAALHYFFIKVGCDFQAEWIDKDLLLWLKDKQVSHHLEAYQGGMGSVFNDLCICAHNGNNVMPEQEVWANRIFSVLTDFSRYFATKISKAKAFSLNDKKKNTWTKIQIPGCRCLDCGYSFIPKSSVDFYICPSIVENEIASALVQNELEKAIDNILALDLPSVSSERERVKELLCKSGIDYIEEPARLSKYIPSWIMRPCLNCGSNNTAVYRWTKKNDFFVPTKDNLKLSKKAKKLKSKF